MRLDWQHGLGLAEDHSLEELKLARSKLTDSECTL